MVWKAGCTALRHLIWCGSSAIYNIAHLREEKLGYAFLLHTYSSPVTHWITLEGSTSRPDKHVVFTILLPLLQVR
jgi:hypothetical protein